MKNNHTSSKDYNLELLKLFSDTIYRLSQRKKLIISKDALNLPLLKFLTEEEKKFAICLACSLYTSQTLPDNFKNLVNNDDFSSDCFDELDDIAFSLIDEKDDDSKHKKTINQKVTRNNCADIIKKMAKNNEIRHRSYERFYPDNINIRVILELSGNNVILLTHIPIIINDNFLSKMIKFINSLSSNDIQNLLIGNLELKPFFIDVIPHEMKKEYANLKQSEIAVELFTAEKSRIESIDPKPKCLQDISKKVGYSGPFSGENLVYLTESTPDSIEEFTKHKSGELLRIYLPFEFRYAETSLINKLLALKEIHPNFSSVIDYICLVAQAQEKSNLPLSLGNLLIVGKKDSGKTSFLKRLSSVLDAHYKDLSGIDNFGALYGVSFFWSSSYPGFVLESVCRNNKANNVFIFDSIDEISTNHLDGNNNLSKILSKEEASSFSSDFYRCNIDLSNNSHILCARNISSVSPAILNEAKIFEVKSLTYSEKSDIINNEWMAVMNEYNIPIDEIESLSDAQVNTLLQNNLKRALNILREAILKAYVSPLSKASEKKTLILN